ncbi:MFS transporter [Sphaerisporangium rubeum]|uniref:MFS family permease n=1 Tax=Sphaerisporangium rubeum TaxID=321317 RepID=A0A7X0IJ26_9ACTN|nr:MFS transporter [Sphaerisporangium rubeum]MBB6476122.1 MFS family permease [Sphaerisporangium rubeum]
MSATTDVSPDTDISSEVVLPAPVGPRGAAGHRAGFWIVAATFLVAMAFTTVPTPLWAIYQREDGFSTAMVTVAFAAYAVGVVVSLFLAGHLSDHFGRRRILIPALLIELASAAMFLTSTSLGVLIVARAVSGLAIGMITATATAYLTDLHTAARRTSTHTDDPRATIRSGSTRARAVHPGADLVATAANMGGFGVGSLASGLLAEYAPSPLRTPYLVFLVLLVLSVIAMTLVPETVRPTTLRPPYRPQRVSVPDEHRPAYFAAASAAFTTFAVLGLFTSVAPGFVSGTLHHPSRALAGFATFLVFAAAATTQTALRRLTLRSQLATGLVLLPTGLITLTTAVWLTSLPLFLAGGLLSGAGAGTLFKATVTRVLTLATPTRRGEALAGLFLTAYIGLTVPILALGLATHYVSSPTALLGFAATLIAICATVSRRLLR